ncbi:MAG: NADH:ubiquinone reductase (Na(+)-transporting) subunit B [Bacteroidales bacterium]|nr:NADH:ubiquinone reductase (Na(+)-transporting) subunit B [Candidatus Sodaliphilus aphodohippi]
MKALRNYMNKIKPHFQEGGKLSKLGSVYDGMETFLFTPNTTSSSGVHIHDGSDMKRTMTTVIIALLPCLLFGMYNIGLQHFLAIGQPDESAMSMFVFGLLALLPVIVVSYVVGLGIEFISAQIHHTEIQEGFLVTGLLIPLIVPINTPLWMTAVATAFAVIFAKEVFGGTGMNIFNVALITRAVLFFSYPSKMSGDEAFVKLDSAFGYGGGTVADTFTGATPLGQVATTVGDSLSLTGVDGNAITTFDAFMGTIAGSPGETSMVCILIGALILLITGVASWRVMLSVFVGGFAMATLANALPSATYPASMLDPVAQLCFGGFAFAAVFMATDPVTGARTNTGQYIYGFLIGVIAMLIRTYNSGYPEGAMLAVLLMNAFAPLIDHCVVSSNIKRRARRALNK